MGAAADTDNRSTHETEPENREKTEDEGEILTRQELHLQEARTDVATAGQTENDGSGKGQVPGSHHQTQRSKNLPASTG